jgi:hypothetical protein
MVKKEKKQKKAKKGKKQRQKVQWFIVRLIISHIMHGFTKIRRNEQYVCLLTRSAVEDV